MPTTLRLCLRRAVWLCALSFARCTWTSGALLLAALRLALLLLASRLLPLARTLATRLHRATLSPLRSTQASRRAIGCPIQFSRSRGWFMGAGS